MHYVILVKEASYVPFYLGLIYESDKKELYYLLGECTEKQLFHGGQAQTPDF